ncbi:sugar kinase, partial [bacterium]
AGTDLGQDNMGLLVQRDIDTLGVQIVAGKTFRWKARYGQALSHATTLATELNVLENHIPALPPEYQDSQFVFLAANDPHLQAAALQQLKPPHFCLCDTMNLWIGGERESLLALLRQVHALALNDEEARQLCETSNLVQAAQKLHSWGPSTVIIKRGEHGALLSHRGSLFLVPGFPLSRVVDPTGAGDALAGGLIGYLSQVGSVTEEHLRRGLLYGNVLASFTIEDFGVGRLKTLTGDDIEQRYKQMCRMTQLIT